MLLYAVRRLVSLVVVLSAVGASAAGAQPPRTTGRQPIGRVVGVFDEQTGQPIEGAQVRDLATDVSASTSATGTVDLSFVDTTTSLFRITKIGYQALTLPISNSPRDSVPLTLTLKPLAQLLGSVVTTAKRRRGPADTLRKLEVNGFYERRETGGAPMSAFVTAEAIEKLTILNDLPRLTGRPICADNLYVDGVKVDVASLTTRRVGRAGAIVAPPLHDGIDAILGTRDVLAIEMYVIADSPSQFNQTRRAGSNPCGATLIWTK